jgi:hypothetical protein
MTVEIQEAVLPPVAAPRKFKSQYVPAGRVVKGKSYGGTETNYDDPDEAPVAPVGEKRGRGRPPKAKVASVPNVHPLLQHMFGGGLRKESVDMLSAIMLESIQTAEYEELSEEELEELSIATMKSYRDKAGTQIGSLKYGNNSANLTGKQQVKRLNGMDTATNKMADKIYSNNRRVENERLAKESVSDDESLESIYEGRATVANDDEAHELHLYASNHAQLHRQQIMPIIANLSKKHAKGTYDHEKAKKLWTYAADSAAKHYEKEHGGSFNAATRRATGAAMADEHADEHGWK